MMTSRDNNHRVPASNRDAMYPIEEDLAPIIYRCLLDAMIVMDHKGCIREFNHHAEHLFGYRRDEVLGKELADIIVPEEMREAHRQGLARFLETGEHAIIGQRIEIEGLKRTGERIPVEMALATQEVEGESIFVATIRDLTGERRKQSELDRVRGYLDTFAKHGPSIIFSFRVDESARHILLWVSPNLSELLSIKSPDLDHDQETPLDWRAFVHEDDIESVRKLEEQIVEQGSGILEYRIVDREGTVRWIRDSRRIADEMNASYTEVLGCIVDITETRLGEVRERLLRQELDHRVKNNLQVILGECDKATMSDLPISEIMEGLKSRIRSLSTVHRLLASNAWSPISLEELIQHSAMALSQTESSAGLQCNGPPLPLGVDVATTLGAVFNELITNAAKYGGLSAGGGGVEVDWSIEEMGGELVINWRENVHTGTVIPPDQRGFGMQLIESMIPYELDGEVRIDFHETGMVFYARIPGHVCSIEQGRVRGRVPGESPG